MIVFWGRIHRMILFDLFKVFTLALVALTGLILMAGIISEGMKNGLSPMQMLAMLPLMLPSMLPYTVPATTLFATCIVYGRLSADNEIMALKASGVHVFHVIWPALVLGILASAATLFLYVDVIPYTSFILRKQAADDVEEVLYGMLRKDNCIRHKNLTYEIHISNLQGHMLQDAVFMRRTANGKEYDAIIRAREAELKVDLASNRLHIHMHMGQLAQHDTSGVVEVLIVPVEIPDFILSMSAKQRATDMTWSELFEYEEVFRQDKLKIGKEIERHQSAMNRGRGQAKFREHIANLTNERKTRDSQILSIHSEWHMRAAFALGCFCFALVGCPVGIWLSKSDYLSAFVTCFLPIVTVYYPLMFCTINLARSGKFAPWLGIYDANVLLLIAGVVLFRRLTRN